jgi:proton-dependent oligopeptide transporter, POT family
MAAPAADEKAIDRFSDASGHGDDHSIIEGSEGVTVHDMATYRHVGDRLPWSAWLVVFVEFAERYVPFSLPSLTLTFRYPVHFSDAFFCDLSVDFSFSSYRWTYYGTTNIYNNYIRFPLPPGSRDGHVLPQNIAEGVAGALGLGVQKSFAIRKWNLS